MTEHWPHYSPAEPPNDTAPPPTRVCRKCSVQSPVLGEYCPSCGKPFAGRRGPSKKTVIVGGVVAAFLIAGAATGFLVKQNNDRIKTERAAAAAAQAQREADEEAEAALQAEREAQQRAEAEKAAAKADQERADRAERELRSEMIGILEDYITTDAKEKVSDGLLEGPILETSCTATGGGSTDDLTALTGTFSCIAVNEKHDDGTMSGYRYGGTIEWATGDLTWRLGG